MIKASIDFSFLTDAKLYEESTQLIAGLTGNANFVFTGGAFTNLVAAEDDYKNKLAALSLRGVMEFLDKKASRKQIEQAMKAVCEQVNNQAKGDVAKLISSGARLTKAATRCEMPVAHGLKVTLEEISGNVKLKVAKPHQFHYGTLFAYVPAEGAPADINQWKTIHSNGHKIVLDGLVPGVVYNFAAAYKGRDGERLKWCPFISRMVA
jgi:hypothetical protein